MTSTRATSSREGSPGDGSRPPETQNGKPRRPPKLADGVRLEGRYEDSGYEDPPYVARRADGQMIQLPPLLYAVAEEADGTRGYDEIAERVTERIGRGVSGENVELLVDEKLRPIGVLAQADGSSPKLHKVDPLLALRLRAAIVPERATRALAAVFAPLFHLPVVIAVLAGLVAVDVWYFAVHGVAQSTRTLIYNPLLLLVVLGLVVVGTAWHELGHASALRYGGGRPGAMGAGVYLVWPAFYTDVTDAYRLDRAGRIRTDLGGVYFNAIFVLGLVGAYLATGLEFLLATILVVHLQVIQQFLPFLRLDGYYLVSDITGVPDLFGRIKPTLKSVLPGQETPDSVEQLKPWVRKVTTAWVLLMVPVIALVFGFVVFNAPRMVATGWDSFWVKTDALSTAFGDGKPIRGSVAAVQTLFLVLPLAGLSYTFGKVGWRLTSGAWSWSADSALRRGAVVAVAGSLAAVGAYTLVPNGDYEPIQRAERGTIQGGVKQFAAVASGRPGLAPEREQELGEVVRVRDLPPEERDEATRPADDGDSTEQPAPEDSGEPATTTETTTPTTTADETGTGTTTTETTPTTTTTGTTTATTTTTTSTTETTP